MRRFFSPFWIVVLTCSIGIAATFLWVRFNPEVEKYETTDFTRIPSVEYCDLRANPQKYDGKIIRVKTKLYWFMHGYYLANGNCSEGDDKANTAISFYPANSSGIGVTLDKFRKPYEPFGPVNLAAVGRFTYKDKLGGTDSISDRTHLHFEIYEIESAEK
jgi:hypothetical protein